METMRLQTEVLFRHNEALRLTGLNESDGGSAPQVFWGFTTCGSVLRFHDDLPEDLVRSIAGQVENSEPASRTIAAIVNLLNERQQVQSLWMGPAYRFAELPVCAGQPGITGLPKRVTAETSRCLLPFFPSLWADWGNREPCWMVLDGDRAVSVCFSARQTREAAEAGVETAEGYRGRGYAGIAAAAWAKEIQGQGRLALYSTSWDNRASQAVAGRLSLVPYGTDLSFY